MLGVVCEMSVFNLKMEKQSPIVGARLRMIAVETDDRQKVRNRKGCERAGELRQKKTN